MTSNERPLRFPDFQDRLTKLRNDYGDNTAFSKKINLTRQVVGKYLNGARVPNAIILRQIAEATEVSADWLLGLSEARTPDVTIQAACKFTGLPEETLRTIKKISENPTFNIILQILFSFIDGELSNNGDHFYQCLADLYANAHDSSPFNDDPSNLNSGDDDEETILNEIKSLQSELPEHRKFHLLDASKYTDVLKAKASNEFQTFLSYLVQSAMRWDEKPTGMADISVSDVEDEDEVAFLDEDEPQEEPPEDWEY